LNEREGEKRVRICLLQNKNKKALNHILFKKYIFVRVCPYLIVLVGGVLAIIIDVKLKIN